MSIVNNGLNPAGDVGNCLQEWPSWAVAHIPSSSHPCSLCLLCGKVSLFLLPSLQWKSYHPCLLALPSPKCAGRAAHLHACSPTGSRLNQLVLLSSPDKSGVSTMAHGEWGSTLSLWQSCQCLSNKGVGWQLPGALNASTLQRMVIGLLGHVGMLQWSAAGSSFGHWAASLYSAHGKGVRVAADWSIRHHLPQTSSVSPWVRPEKETEKHSHLFFFTLHPTSLQLCLLLHIMIADGSTGSAHLKLLDRSV